MGSPGVGQLTELGFRRPVGLDRRGEQPRPELEPTTHIGYALGHARVATDEGGDWRLDTWESSESPKVGDDPPSCLDGSCDDNRSVREPHLLAELNDEQELRDLVLSFARELVSTPGERDCLRHSSRPAGRWSDAPPSRCRARRRSRQTRSPNA